MDRRQAAAAQGVFERPWRRGSGRTALSDNPTTPAFTEALNALARRAHGFLPEGAARVVWEAGFTADDVMSSWLLNDQAEMIESETLDHSELNDQTRDLRDVSRDRWTTISLTVTREGKVSTEFGHEPVPI